jgi:hypothetical protein
MLLMSMQKISTNLFLHLRQTASMSIIDTNASTLTSTSMIGTDAEALESTSKFGVDSLTSASTLRVGEETAM